MEGTGEDMTADDAGDGVELKGKGCEIPVEANEPNMLGSPIKLRSIGSTWLQNSPRAYRYRNTFESNDTSDKIVMSSSASEPPSCSPCLISSARGEMVEELTVGNYRISNSAKANSSHEGILPPRRGHWQHLYQVAGGSRSWNLSNNLVSCDKDQMQLRSMDDFKRLSSSELLKQRGIPINRTDQDTDEMNAQYVYNDMNTMSNSLLPPQGNRLNAFSGSSFSQFFAKKTLKGKGVACGNLETGREFGMATQSNEQLSHAAQMCRGVPLDIRAKKDRPSLSITDKVGHESLHDGTSLREWLASRCSKVDKVERLHIFGQIVELVHFAHSKGQALQDLRPSHFRLLSSNRIKYTGSSAQADFNTAIFNDMSRKRPFEDLSFYSNVGPKQQKVGKDMTLVELHSHFTSNSPSRTETVNMMNINETGPDYSRNSKHKARNYEEVALAECQRSYDASVQLEERWYSSPEELNGGACTCSSNIYCLGVLLFELLCSFISSEVHPMAMLDLRHRILPPSFLTEHPKEAGFCLWLLHPEPSSRLTTREILQSDLICGSQRLSVRDEVPTSADGDYDAEADILLHFLQLLKEEKQKYVTKLVEKIGCLEADSKEVKRKHYSKASSVLSSTHKGCGGATAQGFHLEEHAVSDATANMNQARLLKNIRQLEDAYFSTRPQVHLVDSAATTRSDKDLLENRDSSTKVGEDPRRNSKSNDRLSVYFDGICKFAHYSKFEVCGTLQNRDLLNSANVICALSFDRDEDYFAAAGVSKKIKIFEFSALLNDSVDIHYPVLEMSSKSKFSCVCWNNYISNYLTSTDYDGVVQMWDASTGQGFSQYTEHQKRAWSVDFSKVDPMKFASGSDDCSVKLWSINEELWHRVADGTQLNKNSISTIWNPANVCCVQFSAYSTHLLAFGSADYKIYCYDLRNTRIPWCTLAGHGKAVSYVKFLDSETLISASTDSTLKLWDLNKTSLTGLSSSACCLTFSGHTNEKNFVGLSVWDGYIACGSENNKVCAYYRSLPMPITSHKFGSVDPITGHEVGDDNGQFVSSVCWRAKSNMVVAANSSGRIKILRI
ncbi:WD40 repeat, partial [Dillenia turbinata]